PIGTVVKPRFDPDFKSPPIADPAPRKRYTRRILAFAALLVLGVVAIRAANHWMNVGRYIESTDDAYVGGNLTVLAPKVAGFITQIAVEDNQSVHAGDLLVKIDDRDFRSAVAKAEATVGFHQAALKNLAATRTLQHAVIAQAEASIAAADAEITRTRDDQARFKQLVKQGAVSIQESQKADAGYVQAMADGDKARAALAAAQGQFGVLDAQEQQIRASLAQANADLDIARLNLSYTEVRAPIDGTVGNRNAQAGAYTPVGSQLLSLVPAHGLWVDANLKERQLKGVRPGAPATVEVDSIPGRILHGHVVSIAPATGSRFSILPPENATGNFTKIVQRVPVRIVLDAGEDVASQLRPGLSVTAKINTAPAPSNPERSSL
ncbi:MAG: h16, partial [Verrucomicrobiales bacterium]|nr:h16 [Verrucomicrobiales bacterium]